MAETILINLSSTICEGGLPGGLLFIFLIPIFIPLLDCKQFVYEYELPRGRGHKKSSSITLRPIILIILNCDRFSMKF